MVNYDFTAEQLEIAKACKSPEELIAKAKEQGANITLEQAAAFLDGQTAELADEELDNVAGGYCHDSQGREVVTTFTICCHGLRITCGQNAKDSKYTRPGGRECKYLSYEKGIWYCNYNIMPH